MADSIVTPVFRLSFPQLFEAKGFKGGEPKFSATMLFDEAAQATPQFAALVAAAKAAAVEKWGDKVPTGLRNPFRKGEEKPDLDGYEPGMIFVKATAKEEFPPDIVDQKKQEIVLRKEVYAGCYCRAVVTAFAYDGYGTDGVSFGLRAIQKVGDAPSFGGGGAELLDELPMPEGQAAPAAAAADSFLD